MFFSLYLTALTNCGLRILIFFFVSFVILSYNELYCSSLGSPENNQVNLDRFDRFTKFCLVAENNICCKEVKTIEAPCPPAIQIHGILVGIYSVYTN